MLTSLIHVILALGNLLREKECAHSMILADGGVAFRENYKFVAWDIVFLDSIANDFLTQSIAINIRLGYKMHKPPNIINVFHRRVAHTSESLIKILKYNNPQLIIITI